MSKCWLPWLLGQWSLVSSLMWCGERGTGNNLTPDMSQTLCQMCDHTKTKSVLYIIFHHDSIHHNFTSIKWWCSLDTRPVLPSCLHYTITKGSDVLWNQVDKHAQGSAQPWYFVPNIMHALQMLQLPITIEVRALRSSPPPSPRSPCLPTVCLPSACLPAAMHVVRSSRPSRLYHIFVYCIVMMKDLWKHVHLLHKSCCC